MPNNQAILKHTKQTAFWKLVMVAVKQTTFTHWFYRSRWDIDLVYIENKKNIEIKYWNQNKQPFSNLYVSKLLNYLFD